MATRKPVTAPSSASRKNISTSTKDTVNKNKNKNRDTTDNKEARSTSRRRTPVKPPLPRTSSKGKSSASAPRVNANEQASSIGSSNGGSKSGGNETRIQVSPHSKEVVLARMRAMQRIKSHKKKKKADAEMAKIESEQVQHRKRVARQESILVSISKQQTLKGPAVEPSEDGGPQLQSRSRSPVVK